MRVARGSWPWIATPFALGLLLFLLSTLGGIPFGWVLGEIGIVLGLFLLIFFRDPERAVGKGALVSPADGVVVRVDPTENRVSIFMSPFDVHVNRSPLDGRVVSVVHKKGGHLPAFRKDSERNERVDWTIESERGTLKMSQIAGTIARRIVPYVGEGAWVEKGQRIGMIRLGSRVDVWVPSGLVLKVREGDRVWAGTTTLADESG